MVEMMKLSEMDSAMLILRRTIWTFPVRILMMSSAGGVLKPRKIIITVWEQITMKM